MSYDIVVIGGGPGGYAAALKAAQSGARVALVEAREMGGTCLNRGCIPSKSYLHQAASKPPASLRQIAETSKNIVQGLRASLEHWVASQAVDIVHGRASLEKDGAVRVTAPGNAVQTLQGKHVILAVGSEPAALPFWPLDEKTILSSDGMLALDTAPKTLLIVGGGAVGVEWADVMSGLGVRVKIMEMQSQLLPSEDPAAAKILENALKARGVEIVLGARVQETDKPGFDKVLVAVGRKPALKGLGLEALGVVLNKGFVAVNASLRTNVPWLYAVGDVNGLSMLAHAAIAQGRCVASTLTGKPATFEARSVPRCVYTQPEVASVGITEAQARESGLRVVSGKFPYAALGKAKCIGSDTGFIKILAEEQSRRIVGVHIVGSEATDLIGEACLMVHLKLTLSAVIDSVHPHPTLCEGLWEAACVADGQGLHGGGPRKAR